VRRIDNPSARFHSMPRRLYFRDRRDAVAVEEEEEEMAMPDGAALSLASRVGSGGMR
jgi:hypothetical protein